MVTINNAGNDGVQKTDLMKFADFKATVLANTKSETSQKILQYFQEQNLKDDDYVDLNKINHNQDEKITKDEWRALGIDISNRSAKKLDKALQAQRSSAHEKAVEEMNKMKELTFTYKDGSKTIDTFTDLNGDGEPDRVVSVTYDKDGNEIPSDRYSDEFGVTTNENGNEIKRLGDCYTIMDDNGWTMFRFDNGIKQYKYEINGTSRTTGYTYYKQNGDKR